jgi:hypothetical protein
VTVQPVQQLQPTAAALQPEQQLPPGPVLIIQPNAQAVPKSSANTATPAWYYRNASQSAVNTNCNYSSTGTTNTS